MFCRRSPRTYLIWLIDEYPWRAGTRMILCLEHAYIIGRRIGDGHLVVLCHKIFQFPRKFDDMR
jgi:hypothetical protein